MYFSKHMAVAGLVAMTVFNGGLRSTAYAAQETAKTSVAVDDSTLHDRVDAAIKAQPTLKDQDIDVKVENKVVTLTGTVQTASRKSRAASAAHVAGVTRVVNELKIDPKAGKNAAERAGSATAGAAATAGKKTEEAAKTVGEKTKEGVSATGEVITDAWINTKIHTDMMNEPTLKGSDINVDVKDHMVTLKGTVASAAGKARAEAIAKGTSGVTMVHNDLVIGPKK